MANICSNDLTITGDKTQLKRLYELITDQDETLLEKFCWFNDANGGYGLENLDEITEYFPQGSISLAISSKWGPPTDDLASVSEDYPDLVFIIKYSEPSMEIFGQTTICAGQITEHIDYDPYDWYIENYEDCGAEAENIKTMDYDEFIEEYVKPGHFQETAEQIIGGWLLEKDMVNRVKDEDLPLMMNFKFMTIQAKELFNKRIKGEKITHEKT